MTEIINSVKPYNRWDHSLIQPGVVGSVGDVLVTPRLKSSLPGNFNWDAEYYGRKAPLYGSSISDGSHISFNSGGGPARTLDSNWGMRRNFETSYGWYYQDLRAPDKSIEPEMGPLPQYGWRNRIASVNNARSTGDLFMPLPSVLPPENGLPRGGMFPRVTDIIAGNGESQYSESAINTIGDDRVAPNFHPHLSSFGQLSNNIREQRDMNRHERAGTLGRMRR